jgi:hypothetical protein
VHTLSSKLSLSEATQAGKISRVNVTGLYSYIYYKLKIVSNKINIRIRSASFKYEIINLQFEQSDVINFDAQK